MPLAGNFSKVWCLMRISAVLVLGCTTVLLSLFACGRVVAPSPTAPEQSPDNGVANMQEVQKLKLGIANIEEKNEQAQVQILKANEDNLDLTKKVNSLEKEKGELNKALSDAKVANKKAREDYVAAIQAVENELKATNELLEKEKSNSLMISEKLDLSDSQLKKLMLEIENLNAKIKDLEQPD